MFDAETGRCHECDGHYTHSEDCSEFEGPSALTVQMRCSIYALVAR